MDRASMMGAWGNKKLPSPDRKARKAVSLSVRDYVGIQLTFNGRNSCLTPFVANSPLWHAPDVGFFIVQKFPLTASTSLPILLFQLTRQNPAFSHINLLDSIVLATFALACCSRSISRFGQRFTLGVMRLNSSIAGTVDQCDGYHPFPSFTNRQHRWLRPSCPTSTSLGCPPITI